LLQVRIRNVESILFLRLKSILLACPFFDMPQQSSLNKLKERVVKGGAVVIFGHFGSQGIRLVSNLIMARLLVPEAFGVMAVAQVIFMGLSLLSDVGIQQNIIQSRRGNDSIFLNTAWTLNIIRGWIIWFLGLVVALSVYWLTVHEVFSVSSAYGDPVLPYVIAVLSFSAVIHGLDSTKIATANRNLAMTRLIAINLSSQMVGFLVMIFWVMFEKSIWALVAGSLSSSFSRCLLSHYFLPGESNRLHWNKDTFWELFHFGKWVFVSSILGFIAANGDKLVLGGLIDAGIFGVYAIALLLVGAIQGVVSALISKVAFPALSEVVREDPQKLKKVFYHFRLPTDIVLLSLTGFLFVSGSTIIEILYDERYQLAGYILEIISLKLIMLRYTLVGQCYIAMGKPRTMVPVIFLRALIMAAFLPVVFHAFGFDFTLWFVALGNLLTLPIVFYLQHKIQILDMWKEVYTLPFFMVGMLLGYIISM